eukprot:scaffold1351_cov176-Amphora_coffeaeformis.AAC.7
MICSPVAESLLPGLAARSVPIPRLSCLFVAPQSVGCIHSQTGAAAKDKEQARGCHLLDRLPKPRLSATRLCFRSPPCNLLVSCA